MAIRQKIGYAVKMVLKGTAWILLTLLKAVCGVLKLALLLCGAAMKLFLSLARMGTV